MKKEQRANPIAYFGIYKGYVGNGIYLVFMLSLLASLAEGVGIVFVIPLIAAFAPSASNPPIVDSLLSLVRALGFSSDIAGALVLICGAFILKASLKFGALFYSTILQANLLGGLRKKLFDASLSQRQEEFAGENTGSHINVLTTQVESFYNSFSAYVSLLSYATLAAIYNVFALIVEPLFGLIAIGVGAGSLAMARILNSLAARISVSAAHENGIQNGLLVESLQARKYLISTNTAHAFRSRLALSVDRLVQYDKARRWLAAVALTLPEPIVLAVISIVVYFQVGMEGGQIAAIVTSLILLNRGVGSILALQGVWVQVLNGAGGIEQLGRYLSRPIEERPETGAATLGPGARIEFQDVHFCYPGTSKFSLQAVSVQIPDRATVAIVGPSGSGKSTLVDIISLVYQPTSGRVSINGVDAGSIDASVWRSRIGYVCQESVIFDDTLRNNVTLGQSDDQRLFDDQLVWDALRKAGLKEFVESLPGGLQTRLGDRGARLSGGQKQRLFIARELYRTPALLILDEATSALDSEAEAVIKASLASLKGRQTTVVVAHRLSTIIGADLVIVLHDGKIVESGCYDALAANESSMLSQMLSLQGIR